MPCIDQGPMQFIPNYIERKHGREEVEYDHEDLIPLTSSYFWDHDLSGTDHESSPTNGGI